MKLRIRGDSLRIRVAADELERLRTDGRLEERMRLGPERALAYRLRIDAAAQRLAVELSGAVLEVRLPQASAHAWCASEQVSLSDTLPNGAGGLKVVVEKDFDSSD